MLNTQRYLRTEGNDLVSLKEHFNIVIHEYDKIVTLNYHQINSPRFHPIADECRGLILEKDTWDIVARSFSRFYNLGEGHSRGHSIRLPSFGQHEILNLDDVMFGSHDVNVLEKLDGTLVSAYFYDDKWNFATRKMAFAEGPTNFDMTFADLIKLASNYKNVMKMLESEPNSEKRTWVFELTSPANRIVTPYDETKMNLLTVIHKASDIELSVQTIQELAKKYQIGYAEEILMKSWMDLLETVTSMPSMEEGVVIVIEDDNHYRPLRLKVKNPKFVAIAHMRENGSLSPTHVLKLIMDDEQHEYLSYFSSDKKYFDLAQDAYVKFLDEIMSIYLECEQIESQKDFAMTIMGKISNKIQSGFLFKMRQGKKLSELIKVTEPKKLAEALKLKSLFVKEFDMSFEKIDV